MQPAVILASQLPIMFMKGIQIKTRRILTEDVQRHLFLMKTHSALKFKRDRGRKVPWHGRQLGHRAGGGTGAVTFRLMSQ